MVEVLSCLNIGGSPDAITANPSLSYFGEGYDFAVVTVGSATVDDTETYFYTASEPVSASAEGNPPLKLTITPQEVYLETTVDP